MAEGLDYYLGPNEVFRAGFCLLVLHFFPFLRMLMCHLIKAIACFVFPVLVAGFFVSGVEEIRIPLIVYGK